MRHWKIILAVAVIASFLLPATSVALVHNATGSVSFSDSDAGYSSNLSDQLTVSIQNIFAVEGETYYAWLSSDDQSSFLLLGAVELDGSGGGSLTYTSPDGENLINNYNGFWVERTDAVSTQPHEDSIVMSDVILPGSMAHIRHVISAWAPATDGKGQAVGSREQTDIALTHATLSVNSSNLSGIQQHAHHVINIIEGSSGDNYDASFGDPGDGFGVLQYAADANKHSGFAAAAEGASANVALHSVHIQDTSTNVANWATQARDKALEALDSTSFTTGSAAMVEAQKLLDWALNGRGGSSAPVLDGGGAQTAYLHGQLMAGYSPVFNTDPPSAIQPQVDPTATLLPPTPGDVAPGSNLLIGLLIAAFILIAAGSYYLRQSRQS